MLTGSLLLNHVIGSPSLSQKSFLFSVNGQVSVNKYHAEKKMKSFGHAKSGKLKVHVISDSFCVKFSKRK